MHEKNGALDQTIHWLLGQTIFAAAAFTALEAAFPEAFLLTAGRVFAQMLQGTWFCQAASVLFGGGCGAAGGGSGGWGGKEMGLEWGRVNRPWGCGCCGLSLADSCLEYGTSVFHGAGFLMLRRELVCNHCCSWCAAGQ